MPANLPPLYYAAEKEYRRARTPAEKLEALETMMAVMPKHKGTDHLRAELRARMASVTEEAARPPAGAQRAQPYNVHREGAGQVALVGMPNAGKSQLLAALTHATPRVAEYPFTTQLPQPGMMPVENVQVQLVDLPAVVPGETPGWQRALIRRADVLLLVIDLAVDPLADWAALETELAAMRVRPVPSGASRAIETEEESAAEPGGANAAAEVDRPEQAKKALIAANKCDLPDARVALELLEMEVAGRLPIYAVCGTSGEGLEVLRRELFAALDVVRAYTKPPGKPADRSSPFVLPRGSTVGELADAIHHELREKLRYATLWGTSGKFPGARVGHEHVLEDGDVIELHEK